MKVKVFQFHLFAINTYVVYDPATGDCAVIDPGMIHPSEATRLDDFINENHMHVTHLINTHMHIDHVVADAYVAEKYLVGVSAHPGDENMGERLDLQAAEFGLNGQFKGVTIAHYLKDGDVIRIGEGELKVLHVPGHSPGSVVLYDRQDGFIIAGDVLFAGSIGRTDLPGGSMTELLTGIRSKLMTLPDNTVVYPGHGPATTIGAERGSNLYLR